MDIMKNPQIRKRMRTLLGRNFNTFELSIDVQEPLEKRGRFIYGHGCAKSVCTIMEAAFAIDTVENVIYCGIFNAGEAPGYRYFVEDKKPKPAIFSDWEKDIKERSNAGRP